MHDELGDMLVQAVNRLADAVRDQTKVIEECLGPLSDQLHDIATEVENVHEEIKKGITTYDGGS